MAEKWSAKVKKKAARLRTKTRKISIVQQAHGLSNGWVKIHKCGRRGWGHSCLVFTGQTWGFLYLRWGQYGTSILMSKRGYVKELTSGKT